uniref:Uncharacterized protein n=1 Tax=Anguilla anguilla TaxID=7936 RepID=A0A0E9WBQ6_ANGAN
MISGFIDKSGSDGSSHGVDSLNRQHAGSISNNQTHQQYGHWVIPSERRAPE